jgi:hypothetical protein
MDEFTQVKLTRPMSVGGRSREKGEVLDVSEFDHPLTVGELVRYGAVEPVKAGGKAEK